jgi:hypothetical protein
LAVAPINAMVQVDGERALDHARKADAALAGGERWHEHALRPGPHAGGQQRRRGGDHRRARLLAALGSCI